MDNQCLIILSKFSVAARKVIGAVNPAKLIKDSSYSNEIFQKVDALGDENLILLSLELQNLLGAFNIAPLQELPAEKKKYMFGARN